MRRDEVLAYLILAVALVLVAGSLIWAIYLYNVTDSNNHAKLVLGGYHEVVVTPPGHSPHWTWEKSK